MQLLLTMNHSNKTDEYLIKRIGRKDRQAFTELYERYYLRVFHTAISLLGDRDVAEDFTQDIFLKLWAACPILNGSALFSTYLFAMVRNGILDQCKHNAVERRYISEALKNCQIGYYDNHESAEELEVIQNIINKLHDTLKLPLLLRMQGFKIKEIATILGFSVNYIANKIQEARQIVKEKAGIIETKEDESGD